MRILVVDDDYAMRDLLKLMLKDYEVYEAENGREAIEVFRSTRPDIVLMDIMMPEMDGIAATQELLKMDSNTVIIGVTAFASHKGREILKAGARDVIEKPFTKKKLIETLMKHVNK
jgi:CheY-like chemotaxis protein